MCSEHRSVNGFIWEMLGKLGFGLIALALAISYLQEHEPSAQRREQIEEVIVTLDNSSPEAEMARRYFGLAEYLTSRVQPSLKENNPEVQRLLYEARKWALRSQRAAIVSPSGKNRATEGGPR